MQNAGSSTKNGAAGHLEVFQYPADPHTPALPVWECWSATPPEPGTDRSGDAPDNHTLGAVEQGLRAEIDRRLTEETRKSFEGGREKGRQEGRQTERDAHAAALTAAAQHRTQHAAELVEAFARERDHFLRAAEREVVELALAVAMRILRREAQMDPLLLTGAVRVALGQLSASTRVTLRVPPSELDLWTEAMALLPNLALKPKVAAGEEMRLGDCQVETELGSVDLGIRSQLGEIERGFFDRASGQRPTNGAVQVEPAAALQEAGS